MQVKILKDSDWYGEPVTKEFMTFEGTMIENISNVSFNNENENEIVEFSVNFKANVMIVH